MTKRKPKLVGAASHAGGRKLEITSQHREWLHWALDALNAQAARDAVAAKAPPSSVECPHCYWGFAPAVIARHIHEKH